jgi:hypothetical protein
MYSAYLHSIDVRFLRNFIPQLGLVGFSASRERGKWLRLPQPDKGRCVQSVLCEESGLMASEIAQWGGGPSGKARFRVVPA